MSSRQLNLPAIGGAELSNELSRVVGDLRTALTELITTAGGDPTKPQAISRQFGVNRNLAWKMSRIVAASEPAEAVNHVPGSAGVSIYVSALQQAGGSAAAGARVKSSLDSLGRIVEVHAGDRRSLEVMLTHLSRGTQRSQGLLDQRKLAYQGNCGVLGVQARVQIGMSIMAPNATNPDGVDAVRVGGLVDYRRLRSNVRWLLFRSATIHDDGTTVGEARIEPLDRDANTATNVPVIREFCSTPMPRLDAVVGGAETYYELVEGPVGNTGALTCIYGSHTRMIGGRYREEKNEHAEMALNIITPVEMLVFDLFIHEQLSDLMPPELAVYSRADGRPLHLRASREHSLLPIEVGAQDLGWGMSVGSTPHWGEYAKLGSWVFDRLGWDDRAFRLFRAAIPYPPTPSFAVFMSRLPERPS